MSADVKRKFMDNNSQASMHPNGLPFNETCSHLRSVLKSFAVTLNDAKIHPVFKQENDGVQKRDEMIANVIIAYRHVEDATMRLGKAIQAYDGGKSVYDK